MTPIPIVPLDVPTPEQALDLVEQLGDRCRFYKVGNELFTAAGPSIVRELIDRGVDVFLDLKFHDIPNTVAGGVRNAAALGARLVTVHAAGGVAMLDAAVRGDGETRCGVLAVTVLTSITPLEIADAWGRAEPLDLPTEVRSAGRRWRRRRVRTGSCVPGARRRPCGRATDRTRDPGARGARGGRSGAGPGARGHAWRGGRRWCDVHHRGANGDRGAGRQAAMDGG